MRRFIDKIIMTKTSKQMAVELQKQLGDGKRRYATLLHERRTKKPRHNKKRDTTYSVQKVNAIQAGYQDVLMTINCDTLAAAKRVAVDMGTDLDPFEELVLMEWRNGRGKEIPL